jgi:hypothetical protein
MTVNEKTDNEISQSLLIANANSVLSHTAHTLFIVEQWGNNDQLPEWG